ncbi:MAG: F0F1 ATP synthase subunit B [Bacteroidales bacterium]|nr:F0F1 ATP synthase subunit B [Bacteroidales bacterium]MBR4138173.1 F0F1 ATP synthase subunit B [Bacteroidales bacterium]
MELISPDFGFIFWMTLAFGIVFFFIAKFAFPVINKMLKQREEKITEALEKAERTHEEMEKLQAHNEILLQQAREERERMLNEARQSSEKIIEDAKAKAKVEADRMVESAKESIENEYKAAMTEIKNGIANISIKVAEKILQQELSKDNAQMDYIDKIIKDAENQ